MTLEVVQSLITSPIHLIRLITSPIHPIRLIHLVYICPWHLEQKAIITFQQIEIARTYKGTYSRYVLCK